MRKYHSQRIFDKLEEFATFIQDADLTSRGDTWVRRLRQHEQTLSDLDEKVGQSSDNWEKIYSACSPHMMRKFNGWWKVAKNAIRAEIEEELI